MQWIDENELLEQTGYKHRGWLRRALDKQGIRYVIGRKGRLSVPESAIKRLVEKSEADRVEFL